MSNVLPRMKLSPGESAAELCAAMPHRLRAEEGLDYPGLEEFVFGARQRRHLSVLRMAEIAAAERLAPRQA